jgi:hypothetical protein
LFGNAAGIGTIFGDSNIARFVQGGLLILAQREKPSWQDARIVRAGCEHSFTLTQTEIPIPAEPRHSQPSLEI